MPSACDKKYNIGQRSRSLKTWKTGTYDHTFLPDTYVHTLRGTKDSWLRVAVPWMPWLKKLYHGEPVLNPFRFKNFEHLLLGSGWNHNLRTGCMCHLARTFHTPARSLRLDAPALFRVRSPNNGKSWDPVPLSTLPVLRVLFRCNVFDVSSVFWLFFQANLILIIILIDPV